MLNTNLIRKFIASSLLIAVWSVSSAVALMAQQAPTAAASITVTGKVMVDNREAVSNGTVASGSTITTGESGDSIATIDLGKLGRVQLLSQSSMVLKFDGNGFYPTLLVGKVRAMNMANIVTNVTTKEGMVMGDTDKANTFTVETECGRMSVNTAIGNATMRINGQDKQIAAGTEAVAGSLSQTGCRPCFRPDPNAELPTARFLPLPVLLPLLLGAGVATAFIANNRGNAVDIGNTGIIISPTR